MPYTLDRIRFGPDQVKVPSVHMLQTTGLPAMIRKMLLAGVVTFALTASPAFAKSDAIATDDALGQNNMATSGKADNFSGGFR